MTAEDLKSAMIRRRPGRVSLNGAIDVWHSDQLEWVASESEAIKCAAILRAGPALQKALRDLMAGIRGLPALTAIAGTLEKQYKQAEEALSMSENTSEKL